LKTFRMQLDFFWQSVAFYAVTLIVYVMVKALYDKTIQMGLVNVVLTDPVVVILGLFVVLSVASLIINSVSKRTIQVSGNSITFLNSLRRRTFELDEIEKIIIGKDRRRRASALTLTIRIYIKGRRRPLRILPALYDNEQDLIQSILALRHNGNA
jgi:hypothetical protein